MTTHHQSPLKTLRTTAGRRRLVKCLAVGVLAFTTPNLLAACSSDSTSTEAGSADVQSLTWAIGNGLSDLDSVKNFQAGNWTHTVNTYEAPMRLTDDGEIEAALAESWDQPDPTTIVLTLRQGVKFQDGTDLTADDVVFSLARNLDPEQGTGAGATYYGSVESIEATGDNEVSVRLKSPDPLFPYVLASPAALVTSQAYFEEAGDKFGTSEFPGMGTGPYRFTSFNPSTGYTLEAHDDYWGGAPEVQKFGMKFIEDTQARLFAFQSGELDGTNDVPTNNLEPWDQAGHIQYLNDYFLFAWSFQTDASPWDDVNVRKAIAYATDAEGLNQAATAGQGSVARAMVQPELFANLADQDQVDQLYADLPSYEFDMDKAAEALAASSHADGFTADVTVPNTFPELRTIALNTAENLKALNVTLNVKEVPEEQIYPFWLNLPPDHANAQNNGLIARLFPAGTLPDPADPLATSLQGDQINPGGQNSAAYVDPQVDDLFEEQRSSTDPQARFDALSQILTKAQSDLPYYPIFFGGNSEAVRDGLGYSNLNPYTFMKPWIPTIVSE